MFCGLQGSTALSQQLDPEDLRDVIRGYQEVCADAVGRFEGHIAKYLGDGLLIYFGYPQANEDEPQRAVRAGLAILKDMGDLNAQLKADKESGADDPNWCPHGLDGGGRDGGGDTVETLAIVGETPNIAARLQETAAPNSIVISKITANLVQGLFVSDTLGLHELRGISELMNLFRVLSESGAQRRFDVAVAAQLTPLVGGRTGSGFAHRPLGASGGGIGPSRVNQWRALDRQISVAPRDLRRPRRTTSFAPGTSLFPLPPE